MVVNDAIDFVFNGEDFANYDCEEAGVVCNSDIGLINVGDSCKDYDCNPTCTPSLLVVETEQDDGFLGFDG